MKLGWETNGRNGVWGRGESHYIATVENSNTELKKQGESTMMLLHHTGFPSNYMAEQAEEGWNQSFDKLEEALRSNESFR